MDGDDFQLRWSDIDVKNVHNTVANEETVCKIENVQSGSFTNMALEDIKIETDQIAAENLMFLAQDVVYTDASDLLAADPNVECVTEEVITDDWVGGQDRVEVQMDQLANPIQDIKEDLDDVPLPTDQDEYTAMRPWPCDFCSRRFRKKAALMNHMVAHQNDRPHVCNLCGVRYIRKCDLMNHLKVHAYVPDNPDDVNFEDLIDRDQVVKSRKKRGRRKRESESAEICSWENMTSARTQQWSRPRRSALPPPSPTPPARSPSPSPAPAFDAPAPSDPARPFVCRHCGIGFAREKALQSHSRIHGGDSPIECSVCGELCWSREALATHTRQHHPHSLRDSASHADYTNSDSENDMDYRMSPSLDSDSEQEELEDDDDDASPVRSRRRRPIGSGGVGGDVKGPEMFCQFCGVAFQRADLLRRHVSAAHSYKRHDSTSSACEHICDVCGESCSDALSLLAHAELHADRAPPSRYKKSKKDNSISATGDRLFPCRECGKVFGSRSSQQIHVRIHTGERPYPCRFCWKVFADGGTLRKHERIHTGEKPYACVVCPRAFNQRVVLREHVRSHHSAPDRRAVNGLVYACVVCGAAQPDAAELVQHLIQHCDANTAMKRQPQTGPRKYRRRRKLKTSPDRQKELSASPPIGSPGPAEPELEPAEPLPSLPAPEKVTRRRRKPLPPPAPRPKMIHTGGPKEKPTLVKQIRVRRPPRQPADDLLEIRPSPGRRPKTRRDTASPAPLSPPLSRRSPSQEPSPPASPEDSNNVFKCHMCDLEFEGRDGLLLHVPVHI